MLMRRRALALGAFGVGGAVYASGACTGVEPGPVRATRTLCYGGLVGLEYKRAIRLPEGSPERAAAMAATHQRSAERLLHCCTLHGGLFNKLGQFVSTMNHLLPAAYCTTLQACQDRAETVSLEAARGVIEAELGAPLESLFEAFDATPIASASLAQVHRAVVLGGEEVAVKVQYPHLQQQVAADLRTLRFLAWLVSAAFPNYAYEWLLPEFERTMCEELDFRHEAANAAACAAQFAAQPQVHVPHVLPALSARRVLTMEYIHGATTGGTSRLTHRAQRPAARVPVRVPAHAPWALAFPHRPRHATVHARPTPRTSVSCGRTAARTPSWAAQASSSPTPMVSQRLRCRAPSWRRCSSTPSRT